MSILIKDSTPLNFLDFSDTTYNPEGKIKEISSTQKIYGQGVFLTGWTSYLPHKKVLDRKNTPSKIPLDVINLIEKKITDHLSIADLLTMRSINHTIYNQIWRFIIPKKFAAAKRYPYNLPPISLSHIPIKYTQKQAKGDLAQRLPMAVLPIVEALQRIKPSSMGNQTLMKGCIRIQKSDCKIHFYLFKCITSTIIHPIKSIVILFEYNQDYYVFDTHNTAIESYHPHSPLRIEFCKDFFEKILFKKEGFHKTQAIILDDENIGVALHPDKVSLISKKNIVKSREDPSLFSLSPPINHATLSIKKENLILRALLVYALVFYVISIYKRDLNQKYEFLYSFGIAFSLMVSDLYRGSQKLNQKALKLFFEEPTPPISAFKRIANNLKLMRDVASTDIQVLNTLSAEDKTLLSYTPFKKEAIMLGSNPTLPHDGNAFFIECVRLNKVVEIQEILSTSKFEIPENQQYRAIIEGSIEMLEAITARYPHFNWNATITVNDQCKTGLITLFENICCEQVLVAEERKKKQNDIQKLFYLIAKPTDKSALYILNHEMYKLSISPHPVESSLLRKKFECFSSDLWTNAHALRDLWSQIRQTDSP